MDIRTVAEAFFSGWMGCLMQPGVDAGVSVLRFRPVHEGFDPSCAVYEFCGGYNVLHPAVFHLREEPESSYFCVGHPAQEEHQCCSILPLLACKEAQDTCHMNKNLAKLTRNFISMQQKSNILPTLTRLNNNQWTSIQNLHVFNLHIPKKNHDCLMYVL